MGREISLEQFINIYENGDMRILDVREVWENPQIRGENVINIPMNQLPQSIDKIPRTEDLIVICQHAVRSTRVIEYLENQHGFENLINLKGGVSTYIRETA
jgi:rhodanese-related sulfurtransferase